MKAFTRLFADLGPQVGIFFNCYIFPNSVLLMAKRWRMDKHLTFHIICNWWMGTMQQKSKCKREASKQKQKRKQ
jgi:hypothetical protein